MRIGIDVGGTNTDSVLIDGTQIVRKSKTTTTEDITNGVKNLSLIHISSPRD